MPIRTAAGGAGGFSAAVVHPEIDNAEFRMQNAEKSLTILRAERLTQPAFCILHSALRVLIVIDFLPETHHPFAQRHS